MLSLRRVVGLPARYVSGHLVGEGGSHAWVEVVVSDASARATSRTHYRRASQGYFTVAVGRDYNHVAPTSGTFEGKGPGVLSARKRLHKADSDSTADYVFVGKRRGNPRCRDTKDTSGLKEVPDAAQWGPVDTENPFAQLR